MEIARASRHEPEGQEEVRAMSETVERTWAEEMEARIGARAEAQGKRDSLRDVLCTLLADFFGTLPDALVQQIQACEDVERLKSAIRQVPRVQSLDQFQL
jgi:hypothetical protein